MRQPALGGAHEPPVGPSRVRGHAEPVVVDRSEEKLGPRVPKFQGLDGQSANDAVHVAAGARIVPRALAVGDGSRLLLS